MIKKQTALGFLLLLALPAPQQALAKIQLSPQNVVDRVLQKTPEARIVEYQAQNSFAKYSQYLGAYDLKIAASVTWKRDESQSFPPSTVDNTENKTTYYNLGFSKEFSTGSIVGLKYEETALDNRLTTAGLAAGKIPKAYNNAVSLTLRQQLMQNAFGYASRLLNEIEKANVDNAKLSRDENLESVLLESMTDYWTVFSSQETLRYALQARDKYQNLVKTTRNKARYNLNDPGQLSRVEAEFEQADQKVKAASYEYLFQSEKLLTKLKYEPNQEIDFVIGEKIPPLPKLDAKSINGLRAMRLSKTKLEQAKKDLARVQNMNLPQLDLVGSVQSVGIDEKRSDSFSEMSSGTRPVYYVGLEFTFALDSETRRGNIAQASVNRDLAEANMEKTTDDTQVYLSQVEKWTTLKFQLAKSSESLVDLRNKVVKDMESAYRQGRQPLVELIRSYNDLFTAQQEHAKALGNYHIALNQWASARDELVKDIRGVKP